MTTTETPDRIPRRRRAAPFVALPMRYRWERCRVHPWLGVSIVVTGDAPPLCIGPERNHWAEVAA